MSDASPIPKLIDEFTMDELVEELLSRGEHGVFTLHIDAEHKNDNSRIFRRWKGNSATCAGLCAEASHCIITSMFEDATPINNAGGDFPDSE